MLQIPVENVSKTEKEQEKRLWTRKQLLLIIKEGLVKNKVTGEIRRRHANLGM